ncbi:hypothetical protein [Nocardia puris]|uniref:Uncharacterized protein n=1 Tax=Nocardia puris TaxID=208602 RepID=A0A366DMD3_9NOCA|nr:hypothetical protein [Nocardia puris]MBF6213141.1 hypothetical protein [Nocardia puris]RBO90388.1 hypothetical protein DFR74_106274 [Nocardia puris]
MWTNSTVQFARLIAELDAAGAFTPSVMESLTASMNLKLKDVIELKSRANQLWDETLSHSNPAAWIEEMVGSGALESVPPWQLITKSQAEAWAGKPLTAEQMDRLDAAIPHSGIPDAISAIVHSFNATE